MAGMAVARSAMVPAGGLRSNVSRGGAAAGGAAAAAVAVAGFGRLSLRLQSTRDGVSLPSETKRSLTIMAVKTEGQTEIVSELTDTDTTAPSTSEVQVAAEDLLKQVTDTWEKIDDKLAIGGLGVAALIVLWGSTGLISALDKLPLIPQTLELVGLLYTGWFVYRYLLFKPDREELLKTVDETKSKITGQEDL